VGEIVGGIAGMREGRVLGRYQRRLAREIVGYSGKAIEINGLWIF